MDISLQEHRNEKMILAVTPKLLLTVVAEANAVGRLKGEVEDVILSGREDGTFTHSLKVKKSEQN